MKTTSLLNSLKFMIREAYKRHKSILLTVLLTAFLVSANYLIELFLAPSLLGALENHSALLAIVKILLFFMAALFITNAALAYISQNATFDRIDLRTHIIALINLKAAKTSYANIIDTHFLELMEKSLDACAGNHRASEAIWNTISTILSDMAMLVIYALLITSLDPLILVVIILASVVSYCLESHMMKWTYENRHIDQKNDGRMYYLERVMTDREYAKDIRLFNMKPWLDMIWQRFMGVYDAFHKKKEKRYFIANLLNILCLLIQNIIAFYILLEGTLAGAISVSLFLLYMNSISGLSVLISNFLGDLSSFKKQLIELTSIIELLGYREVYRFEDGREIPSQDELVIELKDVSYYYPNTDKPVLSHINLTLHPHEKLAIVGVNGAGKTTLIKILCGLLDPSAGQVLLNGVDIKEFDRSAYYRLFATIFQDMSFMEESLRLNITQSFDKGDEERLQKSLKEAELEEMVQGLKDGLATKYGRQVFKEGIELSGGQKQKLALARALYKDAKIMILDEPTAALDPLAEKAIYQKYNAITSDRPSIFISHRLASTRFCDRIILISDNKIKEEGSHDDLMALGGLYKKMFDMQSKYYQEGEANEV